MISLLRPIPALSALLIVYIDPSEPDRFFAVTHGPLVAYSLYSALLYYLPVRRARLLPDRVAHRADVACFLVLIALSSVTSSIYFFVVTLVASFRWGFGAGFSVTLCSALLFTFAGYATAPGGPEFEPNRFLLRPICLVVLGYMTAYRGGSGIRLRRRLGLLKEVTNLSNPRFDVNQTVGSTLRRLRDHYGAERERQRLAAELIRVGHEGLSNVRRHAAAGGIKITVARANGTLRLCVENEDAPAEGEAARAPFVPGFIAERAAELGGSANVERAGRTLVQVEVPL